MVPKTVLPQFVFKTVKPVLGPFKLIAQNVVPTDKQLLIVVVYLTFGIME